MKASASSQAVVTLLLVGYFVLMAPVLAQTNDITRVSIKTTGLESDGASGHPSTDSTGRYIAFHSSGTNLIEGDNNGVADIFLHDRQDGSTSLITQDDNGIEGNGASSNPFISSTGRYIAFQSFAGNLLTDDISTTTSHIYVYDSQASSDAFTLISQDADQQLANRDCANAVVSSDGRYVVFESLASNLEKNETDNNDVSDIFVFDRNNSSAPIRRISEASDGTQGNGPSTSPSMSSDGCYIVFESGANNLVSGDSNAASDIFLYDNCAGTPTITRISVDSSANQANGASTNAHISADGSLIAYQSTAPNLTTNDTDTKSGIFLYTRSSGAVANVSVTSGNVQCNGQNYQPVLAGDASNVAFLSDCTNLISNDNNNTENDGQLDVFVYTISGATISRENVLVNGSQGDPGALNPALSGDGSVLAFESTAGNLVLGDQNGIADIFVTDTACPTDTDSDSAPNCTDGCYTDPNKTAEGVCGCGVTDTDTDSDGTLDCNDECDDDPAKTTVGVCDCGVSDQDVNGNGVSDCRDPTSSTVPYQVTLAVKKGKLKIIIPARFTVDRYEVQIFSGNRLVKSLSRRGRSITVSGLPRGKYKVRYRVKLGSITSKYSRKVRAKI